jgi:hypothetical protein
VGSNINGEYTYILTNNAQELAPYRFGFKCDTNRIRKVPKAKCENEFVQK